MGLGQETSDTLDPNSIRKFYFGEQSVPQSENFNSRNIFTEYRFLVSIKYVLISQSVKVIHGCSSSTVYSWLRLFMYGEGKAERSKRGCALFASFSDFPACDGRGRPPEGSSS